MSRLRKRAALSADDYTHEMERRLYVYIDDILDGKTNVGRLERLAVDRYIADLDRADDEIFFDAERARKVFRFFSRLRHSKGRWGGTQFLLSGWQCFIIWNVFGFVVPFIDGDDDEAFDELNEHQGAASNEPPELVEMFVRRFRVLYVQIARKNGKSTFAAGIALYLLCDDDEPGAEIYCAATKRDQAKIVAVECCRMALKSTELLTLLDPYPKSGKIDYLESDGELQPLGADGDTLDGLNPHGNIIDELHQHKNRNIWEVLLTALGARDQPLHMGITTAGDEANTDTSICYEQRDYSEKVLEGTLIDDAHFSFVCEMDRRQPEDDESIKDDDWTDPDNWRKGNPNLGVSVRLVDLEKAARSAESSPAAQNSFQRLRLNWWTEQSTRWLSMKKWNACPATDRVLTGLKCWGGIDLASTEDLTAVAFVFPPQEGLETWAVRVQFFCPEATVERVTKSRRFPYAAWVKRGFVTQTAGEVCDYDRIEEYVKNFAKVNHVQEIGFDSWNSTQVVSHLTAEGFKMVVMRQGFGTMSPPTKQLERLVIGGMLDHGRNSTLTWNMSGVAVLQDNNDNKRPDRDKSSGKIDGAVATIMALGRAMAEDENSESVYKTRGLISLG